MLLCLELILQIALLRQTASQNAKPNWAKGTKVFPVFKPPYRPLEHVEIATKIMPYVFDMERETIESPLLGLLLAGRSEFNWVVEIRTDYLDEELWSIGNLVTYSHVLTTCRAVRTDEDVPSIYSPHIISIYASVTIYYGYSHLYHLSGGRSRLDRSHQRKDAIGAGIRFSSYILPHQKCQTHLLLYDFALIRLSRQIRPYPPILGYMPVQQTQNPPDLSTLEDTKNVCYIAAFGRNYRNVITESFRITRDYKVKFRVYILLVAQCSRHFHQICGPYRSACRELSDKRNRDKLICVTPRKKVGAICDHHRGAPLVCDGFVIGFVIRGASWDFCNSLLQFPVVVLRTTEYVNELYEQIAGRKLTWNEGFSDSEGQSEAAPPRYFHHPNSFFITTVLIRWIVPFTYS